MLIKKRECEWWKFKNLKITFPVLLKLYTSTAFGLNFAALWAMYKNRNTGTGNGMRGMRGMGRNVIFRRMSPNILGNAPKHSGECCQTFRGISLQTFRGMPPNIPGNVAKYSGECPRKHSMECPQTFRGMSPKILGNVAKYSRECR